MSNGNYVQLIGNLTADPQSRINENSGKFRATFSIAIDKPDRDGQKQDPTYVDVTVFQEYLARNVVASLRKGNKVMIVGELNSFTTEVVAEGGETKKIGRMSVNAWEVGASLRFVTAQLTKAIYEGNGNSGQAASAPTQAAPAQAPAAAAPAGDPNDF